MPRKRPGGSCGAVQPLRERAVQRVDHERRLARARDAGDRDEAARAAGADRRAQVVLVAVAQHEPALAGLAALGRHARSRGGPRDSRRSASADSRRSPRAVLPRRRARRGCRRRVPCRSPSRRRGSSPRRARRRARVLPWSRSRDERLEQPAVVARVQPDRRLVEHVEHAEQARSDLRREPDALRLAARERAGRAIEREVVEPDVEQEAQPLADLARGSRSAMRALALGAARSDSRNFAASAIESRDERVDRERRRAHARASRPQPRAAAVGTRLRRRELRELRRPTRRLRRVELARARPPRCAVTFVVRRRASSVHRDSRPGVPNRMPSRAARGSFSHGVSTSTSKCAASASSSFA